MPEWIDYNGHLSEAYYVLVFGHATDAVMAALGHGARVPASRPATSLYTLEAHVRYLDQVPPGAHLEVRSSVIGVTGKLLWLWHEMWFDGAAAGDARRCSWCTSTPPRGGRARSPRTCGRRRGAAGAAARTRVPSHRAPVR